MIKPINNHVLIEPMKHESFIEAQKSTFEEIGIVVHGGGLLSTGTKVYFDAWLASKYPSEVDGEFYWLVDYKDIKAVDYGNEVPELSVSEGTSTQFSNHPGFATRGDGTL